jgi:hypothetical protein
VLTTLKQLKGGTTEGSETGAPSVPDSPAKRGKKEEKISLLKEQEQSSHIRHSSYDDNNNNSGYDDHDSIQLEEISPLPPSSASVTMVMNQQELENKQHVDK